jgi:DNA-binding MarR family transcriptional regulator
VPGFFNEIKYVTNITSLGTSGQYSSRMSSDDIPVPTYKKAVLQSVAYKRLREVANRELKPFNLNTTQWLILGVLHGEPGGHKVSSIAHRLQVEVPLITTLSQPLLMSGFITQSYDKRDKRSKPLTITEEGSRLVELIEARLAESLKQLEVGMSTEDVGQYLRALERLIENAEAMTVSGGA